MLRQLLKSAIILLALFSLPLPAMAMSSDAAGMNFALNSNGEITRGAIIPDQRANAAVPDSITLNFTECELHVGESIELIATVWPDSLSARVNLVWNSRNQSVAQVNSHGLVTAVGVGSSVVSVVCGTVRATCEITVKENEILAQSVELTPESAELEVGGKIALVANISPENTTDKSLVWTSSDMTVASVDETGEVTAVAEGACVITATCGEVAGTCAITVKTPVVPADSIVLDPNSAEIEVGKTLEITATVYPENTTDSRLTWRSSDNHVATVREHGHWSATVTAINPGECIITAECYNPDGVILGSSSITVKIHEVIADSILLNLDSAMIAIGEELSLFATVYPDDVTEPLTWQSSNEDIATVDQDGVVKAVAAGECDVTASCGISSSCHIRVYDPADVVITFDCNEARVVLNHEFVLTPSVSIPIRGGLAVTSSDSTVVKAKVDDDKVTLSGVGFGKATISVSSLDGLAQSDTCEVVVSTVLGDVNSDGNLTIADLTGLIDYMLSDLTRVDSYYFDANTDGVITVSDLTVIIDVLLSGDESEFVIVPESVSLNMESAKIDLGGSVVLEALVLPEDVTNSSTSWTSTDESVAIVNDGVVSAVGVGECSIVVMCKDQAAMCRIEVHEIMPEYVDLDQDNVSLLPGASVTLTATVYPESTTNKEVKWTSTNENVATVVDGKVTAVAVGECYIIADCQGVRDTCVVTVQAVEPASVVLSQHNVSLLPGASVDLTATVYPENTTNNTVTWSSTDRNVASVVEGKVTAVAVGECYIIADCQDVRDTCVVTVQAVEPESVVLSQHNVSLLPGASVDLTATVYPENTTNNTVTWSSTNRKVASVVEGKVTAVAVGDCYIIADCQGVRDTCVVNVQAVEPESVVLSQHNVSLLPGASVDLTATVYPENTTNNTVTWSSTNRKVASVVEGKVTAVAVGDCYIIADCQGVRDTCVVNVQAVEPESVVLSQHNVSLLPGASVDLTATVYPENTTNNAVTWSSTNRNVASVVEGKVTAVAVGDCYIIADCQGVRDTCVVNVQAVEPESVVLSQHSVSLLPGANVTLTATVYPENTTNKTVTWSSTNRNVASVVEGKVTAVAVGDCYIIADCQGVRDTCVVTVKAVDPESIVLSQSNVTMNPGSTITLTATVYPENTTNKTVTWSSTNRNVASVVEGKVTAVAVGDCYIIADCQGVRDTCVVTVKAVEPESIVLSQSNVTMNPGSTITLTATVYPANATNNTVTWISSKTTVATVSNGVVRAVAAGECDIIAICQNVQARCHVTVKEENASETIFTVNGVTFSMVPVESGTFLMGAPTNQTGSRTNERPQHLVTVSDYMIGETEVTQELWVAVMGSNPSAFSGDLQRPVDNVSWEMCKEFIDSLNKLTGKNFRFPTEAEWEFAARGGNLSQGYILAGGNSIKTLAWYTSNSESTTHPVAQKLPNELGLYDMSGNVNEWCADWYVSYEWYTSNFTQPVVNPTGPETGSFKTYRGGAWNDAAANCRSAYRYMQSVTIRREFLGLRLAL